MTQDYMEFGDMPWFTTGEQIYGRLGGFGTPLEEEVDWDMAGLALPIDGSHYQFPVDKVNTMKIEAIMDVPDSVLLDSPYGPQEVEMFNIPPRTEPAPTFVGNQFFNPWDPESQLPFDWGFEEMVEEEPVEQEELDHQDKVESVREKIKDKLEKIEKAAIENNPVEKYYIDALERSKELNKKLVDELRDTKDALHKKA